MTLQISERSIFLRHLKILFTKVLLTLLIKNSCTQDAPSITSVPNSKNVIANSSPNIDCSRNIISVNSSSTSYRWTGPGGYSKTGAILDRTVTRTMGGLYKCTATNTAGLSDTATVSINVQFPPTITSVPSNRDVPENNSPNIDCSSSITPGNPTSTSYRWTGPGGYSKTGAVLDRTLTRTQGGQYTCTATNTAGLSDTGQVNINVQYGPRITSVPSSKNVIERSRMNIDCSTNITPGKPSSTSYGWTGPGGYSKTGALLDRTVTRTQGGQYTCTASNTAGLSDTEQVSINVQYGPEIRSVPKSKNVIERSRINIDCSTNVTPGNPSSTNYRWTGPDGYGKNGAVLDRPVTRTQGGQYTCTATNTAGLSDTATVNINVQYLDFPSMTFTQSQVNENDSVQVVCNVTSNPTALMTITNTDTNDNLVNQVNNSVHYDVENVQCLHNGTYQCVAINHGIPRTRSSVSLNVLSPPFPPTEFSYKLTSDKSLSLSWMSMYNGGEEQMFYVEYQRMNSDIKHQLQHGIPDPGRHRTVTQDIYELTTNRTYIFTLYSRNVYGNSEVVVLRASTIPRTNLGLAVGLGVGLPLFVGFVVAAVILIRRKMLTRKKRTDLASDQNAYSDLHVRTQEIDVYEKINAKKTTGPSNEYENVKLKKKEDESHIYANQPPVRKHEDSPIYENHLSVGKKKQNSSDASF